jgi:hypothetical protein
MRRMRERDLADAGYAKGVPMGADLPSSSGAPKAPTFLVAAMKDPLSGNLDRIQIIKGWLDKNGVGQEAIHDVVWGDAAHTTLDRLRSSSLWHQDVARRCHETPGARVELAKVACSLLSPREA